MMRLLFSLLLSLFLLAFSVCTYALPFIILPKAGTTLPITVPIGGITTAYYTVFNNTDSFLFGNFIKSLPRNVIPTFTSSKKSDLCGPGPTFTLAPRGRPGSSCNLKLTIVGPVRPARCRHQCLLICTANGASCAGTFFPLFVIPVPPTPVPPPPPPPPPTPPPPTPAPFNVTVGYYTSQNLAPLSYVSSNSGLSWTPVVPPPVGEIGFLYDVNCQGMQCAAVGAYFNGITFVPLAYVSTDFSWLTAIPPVIGDGQSQLYAVTCQGNLCVSVGFREETEPLSYISTTGGSSWIPSLPPKVGDRFNWLYGVSCNGSVCTAVGFFEEAGVMKPVSYISPNSGVTWEVSAALPTYIGDGDSWLVSVSCNGSTCTGVGFFTTMGINQPVSYVSIDSGNTWSNPIVPPLIGDGASSFLKVTCQGTNCVSTGIFSDNGILKPLAYTSTDSGNTWAPSILPYIGMGNNETWGLTCNGKTCIATGSFFTTSFQPVSYTSFDGGLTWSAPVTLANIGTTDSELQGVG